MGISVESLPPQKRFPPIAATTTLPARRLPSENADADRRDMCPVCKDSYEHDLAKLVAKEFEKSSSESIAEPRQTMPPWLQVAKLQVSIGTGGNKLKVPKFPDPLTAYTSLISLAIADQGAGAHVEANDGRTS